MGAAVERVVDHEHVARPDAAGVALLDRLHRRPHRAQMDRHVRRVGDQPAAGVEHGAGEVQPFLDVDRMGGLLQHHAHLLGHAHEQVVEHLQQHRVDRGAHRAPFGPGPGAGQGQLAARLAHRPPAVLDHGGGVILDQDRRAFHGRVDGHLLAAIHRGLAPAPVGKHPARVQRRVRARLARHRHRVPPAAAAGLDLGRFQHDGAVRVGEAEHLGMGGLEGAAHRGRIGVGHGQRRVGAAIAHVQPPFDADGGPGHALLGQRLGGLGFQ